MAREWWREEFPTAGQAEARARWWRRIRRRAVRIEALPRQADGSVPWVVIVYAGEVFDQTEVICGA